MKMYQFVGTAENVMFDGIKYVWKDWMRGEVGKETPQKEMDNKRIFMTSHMTLSTVPFLREGGDFIEGAWFFSMG